MGCHVPGFTPRSNETKLSILEMTPFLRGLGLLYKLV